MIFRFQTMFSRGVMDRFIDDSNGNIGVIFAINGGSPSAQVDARQKILCDNIKTPPTAGAKVPQIFTIQVNTDGDPESEVLECYANPGNFYPTSATAGIAGAFAAIGTSLSKLRVSR